MNMNVVNIIFAWQNKINSIANSRISSIYCNKISLTRDELQSTRPSGFTRFSNRFPIMIYLASNFFFFLIIFNHEPDINVSQYQD